MKNKNYKKFLVITLITLFVFVFVGLSYSQTIKKEKLMTFLALGTGNVGGTYYPLGKAFANIWTAKLPSISVMSHSTNGSQQNIQLLQKQEIDIAISQSDIVSFALNGTGAFEKTPYEDLKVIMALFPEVIHFIIQDELQINTITDLKGKRVVVGTPGSGNALTTATIFSACNISTDDYSPIYASFDEAIPIMQKKEADAAIVIAGIPTAMVNELNKDSKVKVLTLSEDLQKDLLAKFPYLSTTIIPANTYTNQPEAVHTLALTATLICNPRLSNQTVIDLLDVIFNNLDYLSSIHERAKDISHKTCFDGVYMPSVHPGALEFFKAK